MQKLRAELLILPWVILAILLATLIMEINISFYVIMMAAWLWAGGVISLQPAIWLNGLSTHQRVKAWFIGITITSFATWLSNSVAQYFLKNGDIVTWFRMDQITSVILIVLPLLITSSILFSIRKRRAMSELRTLA